MRVFAVCLGLSMALFAPEQGLGMGAAKAATPVTCQARGAKTQLPDDLCGLVMARLQAAYPEQTFVPGLGGLVFEVYRAGTGALEGRLVTPQGASPRLAAQRKGAPLDRAAQAKLIDALIAQAPTL